MKLLHHPVVGDLDLPFETFPLGADDGQFLLTYTAEPASPSQDALNLLASWAAYRRRHRPGRGSQRPRAGRLDRHTRLIARATRRFVPDRPWLAERGAGPTLHSGTGSITAPCSHRPSHTQPED